MIEFKNVSFRYADSDFGVTNINLHIKKGECVILAGPSGNGKTTLLRLVNGLAPEYYKGELCGELRINGRVMDKQPLWERSKLVGSVFQDPKSQFFSSQLEGEIAFGCENYGFLWKEIVSRTDAAIDRLKLEPLRKRPLDVISSGERQRTAVASVYALGPLVYACDEPAANLDEQGMKELLSVFVWLKEKGYTLLIAEHRLSWLMGLADRLIYIKDGRILWEKTPKELALCPAEEILRQGLRAVALPPLEENSLNTASTESNMQPPVLTVKELGCRRGGRWLWKNIAFEARQGQIIAITGHNGAGKTTFAKIVTGLERPQSGSIFVFGKKAGGRRRRGQCWYGSNDTGTQFFTNSVTEELLLGLKRTAKVLEEARSLLKVLGLYKYKDDHPAVLSGGQKQRLAIACGLLSGRKILVFDEPTSGLDGANMLLIAQVFKQAARQNKTILIVTHDQELISACCNRLWRMDR